MATHNKRLDDLMERQEGLRKAITDAWNAFDEALQNKGGPGPGVWDDELHALNVAKIEALHRLRECEDKMEELINHASREAFVAMSELVKSMGVDKIVHINLTTPDIKTLKKRS